MPAETPVAIVTDATTRDQRILITALDRARRDAEAAGMGAPAIVAIGAIVALHEALAPFCINLGDLA